MADLKISQLTGATTPLAGTEVLPIVQSSATKKVSVADLTTGRNLSALTYVASSTDSSGTVLQVNTSATAYGRIGGSNSMGYVAGVQHIFFNGSTEVGRFTSGNDFSLAVGNLIQGTAARGVNFTANTPAAGMTSQLLNWYEEGTFSPTIVGSTSAGTATYQFGTTARYTRIGRVVYVEIWLSWISGTGTGNLNIGGLPFSQGGGVPNPGISIGYLNNFTNGWTAGATPCGIVAGSQIELKQMPSGGGGVTGIPYSAAGDLFVSAFYSI